MFFVRRLDNSNTAFLPADFSNLSWKNLTDINKGQDKMVSAPLWQSFSIQAVEAMTFICTTE